MPTVSDIHSFIIHTAYAFKVHRGDGANSSCWKTGYNLDSSLHVSISGLTFTPKGNLESDCGMKLEYGIQQAQEEHVVSTQKSQLWPA